MGQAALVCTGVVGAVIIIGVTVYIIKNKKNNKPASKKDLVNKDSSELQLTVATES